MSFIFQMLGYKSSYWTVLISDLMVVLYEISRDQIILWGLRMPKLKCIAIHLVLFEVFQTNIAIP